MSFIVESELIRAHRCVLATVSPKYKAQFYGVQPDKDEIPVDDVSAAAFNEFPRFFYSEEVILTAKNIEAVLNLAKQSLVDAFTNECINFLVEMVKVNNVCWAYRLAILHDIKPLKNRCEPEISANALKMFATDDFISCDRDLLIRILKFDSLCCKETEIFDACIAWAKAVCKQKNVYAEKPANLRAVLGKAVAEIRFGSMASEEFATIHNKFKGFFTADESSEIFCIISKLKDFKSERFNQTLREQTKLPPVKPKDETQIEEVWIDLGLEKNAFKGNDIDSMLFFCNEGIRLRGFVVGSEAIDELDITVMLEKIHLQKCSYTRDKTKKKCTTIAILENPVDIKPLERCFIEVKSRSFVACNNIHNLKSEATVGGVTFKFPTHCMGQSKGLIICLLFNRL